jgi:hypothetical protein
MYDEYLQFIVDKKSMLDNSYKEEFSKHNKELWILNKFLETKYADLLSDENDIQYHDLQFRIMDGWPVRFMLRLLKVNFESRDICYLQTLHIEVVKYIFSIWDKYADLPYQRRTFPHGELYQSISLLKNHLIEAANFDPDEYNRILRDPKHPRFNPDKHYRYYTWWLYCYFPLINNGDELILRLIRFAKLEDAQDMLMFGIYQIQDPKRLASLMIQLITDVDKSFDFTQSGTGALRQSIKIFRKLYQAGYNLLDNPIVQKAIRYTNRDNIEYEAITIKDLI